MALPPGEFSGGFLFVTMPGAPIQRPNQSLTTEKKQTMQDEASYICDSCGEEIVVPVDLTQGTRQQYTEDCPVCCNANLITIEIDPDGTPALRAESEY